MFRKELTLKRTILLISSIIALSLGGSSCKPQSKEDKLQAFISSHVEQVKPLEKASRLAEWASATTGKSEDYQRQSDLTLQIRQIYSNPEEFAFIDEMRKSGEITDPVLKRQLDKLYRKYLKNQIAPELLKELVELSTEIQEKFNTFRGTIDGNEVTSNRIDEILKSETDSNKRKLAWQAGKQVAPVIADDIIKLVKLRNKAAKEVGFDNFHTLILEAGEQSSEELDQIFQQLYELTNEPYAKVKAELDTILASNCGIDVSELMPWHYHDTFFQETPLVYGLDLDTYYKGKNIEETAANFYAGIGLDVESILARSDLYDRPGKNPHAFCTDIDRQGDVRILCNITNTERWMEVTLHELGHAVYDKYQSSDVPYLIREPAHAFTTEAIAMFFGRLSRNPAWMQQSLALTDAQRQDVEKVSETYATLKQLIFARWAMVMYEFEKDLYADPDQDLNKLWWDTVEKYQLVSRPADRNEPDWAAKIHFNIAPCYYHNYLLGELFASQLHNHLIGDVLKLDSDEGVSYVDQTQVGAYVKENIFAPASLYNWNDMIERATGEKLTPKYFVEQFVK